MNNFPEGGWLLIYQLSCLLVFQLITTEPDLWLTNVFHNSTPRFFVFHVPRSVGGVEVGSPGGTEVVPTPNAAADRSFFPHNDVDLFVTHLWPHNKFLLRSISDNVGPLTLRNPV